MQNDFQWTDELVQEFNEWYAQNKGRYEDHLRAFKALKTRQPLFTTEDGVAVHGMDVVVYGVLPELWREAECSLRDQPNTDAWKWFSSEKARRNYTTCYKPCLSFNDVWNLSDNKTTDGKYVVLSKYKLQELVQSKL